MKKRTRSVLAALVCCVSLLCAMFSGCGAGQSASDETAGTSGPSVWVTVSVAGELSLVHAVVTMEDTNGDGVVTLNEVLTTAAVAKNQSFVSEEGTYGLSITELWGDKSGAYGYYVNNEFITTDLTHEVQAGDEVYAYSYQDVANFSDVYSFFDQTSASVKAGQTVELKLTKLAYDSNWELAEEPVVGAVITVDGEATELVTDAEGRVTVTLDKAGSFVISAVSETDVLVPPVCVVEVA